MCDDWIEEDDRAPINLGELSQQPNNNPYGYNDNQPKLFSNNQYEDRHNQYGDRGARGGRGYHRGRGGRGGAQQQNQRPNPSGQAPPNPIPQGCTEFWTTITPVVEASCIHPNPAGRQRCGYCGVVGHGYSQCGYKREDIKNVKHINIHPQRGR